MAILGWGWGLAALFARPGGPRAILVWAVLLRLCFVGTPALLSDDAYRYLWEGTVLNHGGNPFLTTALDWPGLADHLASRVNHPEIPSIYPPVGLLWFRLLALGGTLPFAQALTGIADVGIVALLLRLHRRDPWPAAVYAFHPLAVLESSAGAHLEVVAVLLALGAVVASRHEHRATDGLSGFLQVLGVGAKLLPVAWLPSLLRGRPAPRGLGMLAGLVFVGLISLPLLSAGPHLVEAMGTYARHWEFNALALPLARPLLGELARPVLVAGGALACAAGLWRLRDPVDVWLVSATAFLVLSPTVHPWYVLWALVPSLARGGRAWAVASTALLGGYAILFTWNAADASWSEGVWLKVVTWGPALAVLGATAARAGSVLPPGRTPP